MAIKFYNIKSKETRVAVTEPMISAMWASSDRGPNAHQGQDFGWRLAPEVVVELRRIKRNQGILQTIAIRFKKPVEELKENDILKYISDRTKSEDAPVAQEGDYEDDYLNEIRRLDRAAKKEEQSSSEDVSKKPGRPKSK